MQLNNFQKEQIGLEIICTIAVVLQIQFCHYLVLLKNFLLVFFLTFVIFIGTNRYSGSQVQIQ